MSILRILSYNIRYDDQKDGAQSWNARKEHVASLIRKSEADIFCVQECMATQKDFLENAFPAFGLVGVGRSDGWLKGEMVNIFYNRDRFEWQANGDFWLSETPDVIGSRSWDTAFARLVSWIRLWDKHAQRSFFVFNTHFDHKSAQARQEGAALLSRKVGEIAGEHTAIITGDFNLKPSDATYRTLTERLTDLRKCLPTFSKTSSFNGFASQAVPNLWIDYILTNRPDTLEVQAFEVLEDTYEGNFPSDHFPLLAVLGWR